MTDPTNTTNPAPALRLIVSTSPEVGVVDPTGTTNPAPALRLIVSTETNADSP